jgi:hypothetical protein
VVVALLVGVVVSAYQSAVKYPSTYTTYTAVDGAFQSDTPVGWGTSDHSDVQHTDPVVSAGSPDAPAVSGARFSSGSASVDISGASTQTSFGGLIVSAISDAFNQNADTLRTWANSPLQAYHDKDKAMVTTAFQRYVEQAPQPDYGGMGDMLVSEWTAESPGFLTGRPVHGFRATAISNDRVFTIVCACREQDWVLLKPAFQRILRSVAVPGEAPPPSTAGKPAPIGAFISAVNAAQEKQAEQQRLQQEQQQQELQAQQDRQINVPQVQQPVALPSQQPVHWFGQGQGAASTPSQNGTTAQPAAAGLAYPPASNANPAAQGGGYPPGSPAATAAANGQPGVQAQGQPSGQ